MRAEALGCLFCSPLLVLESVGGVCPFHWILLWCSWRCPLCSGCSGLVGWRRGGGVDGLMRRLRSPVLGMWEMRGAAPPFDSSSDRNSHVFYSFLKGSRSFVLRMLPGSLFQILALCLEKAAPPIFCFRNLGSTRIGPGPFLGGLVDELTCRWRAPNSGLGLWIALCVVQRALKEILLQTGSQCKARSPGPMCSHGFRFRIARAALFWILWRVLRLPLLVPRRMEFP